MEKKQSLVSVVIPSYNRAASISASLESVLNQSYGNLEVIVVDDGSDDGTGELLSSYPDPRVRYCYYAPNKGACYARNYGAALSVGEYLAFQDSDDLWHRDKLEKQMSALRTQGADFVFCGINRVSEKGSRFYYPVHGYDNNGDVLEQFLYENRASTQTMLMKRYVWENVRFDETFRRYQDWDFALRAVQENQVFCQEEALVDSVVGMSSISVSVSSYPALCHLLEKHRRTYEKYPECLARMYRRMARRLKKSEPETAGHYYRKSFEIEKKGTDLAGVIVSRIRTAIG